MSKKNQKLIIGLDIGSTKIVVTVGKILKNRIIKIIGFGKCHSQGIDNHGNIKNLKSISSCIKKAINEAEIIAECNISSIYVSISNKYIKCKNEIGIVPIYNNEVTKNDIKYAIYTAKCIKLKEGYSILHIIPQEYSIDQEHGIKNPIGLSGCRMQAKVHLILHKHDIQKNIIKAINQCNVKIKKIIFSGIASGQAVLKLEEKQSGVCIIDIGGNNISIVIYINGSIQHSQVIPYAGNIVTHDIAYAFNTSFDNAEKIKIKYGSKISSSLSTSEIINISTKYGISTKKIQQNTLIEVIESRYKELFYIISNIIIHIQKKLYEKGQKYKINSGVVLTGGGSQIKLIKKIAQKTFNMPIRIGMPKNIKTYNDQIIHPSYSTVLGLLKYAEKKIFYKKEKHKKNTILSKIYNKLHLWYKKITKI
ncbi:cell division protein FtsA [Buchnera aphidicola]|uniref:cell division protein FtsA n=1 Tax=Buchnera aphidicola TaxID=9 RepID=UPI0031B8589E